MDDKGPEKSPEAFRTISEAATALDLPQHVLRFWETRFPQIKPLKRGGGRRYYRPDDVELLRAIRRLLYDEGYTIKGVQKMLREQGVNAVAEAIGSAPQAAEHPAPRAEPPSPRPARVEPVFEARFESPSGEPDPIRAQKPAPAAPGLGADDVAALRGALAELREAERILAQVRQG